MVIQDDLSIAVKKFAKNVSTDMFPWYFNNHSTRDGLWFMQHSVIIRHSEDTDSPHVNSPAWGDIKHIFDHFCRQNGVTYEKVLRCSINLTHRPAGVIQSDPHVDHMESHNVFLLYLNECHGDTLIYDKTHSGTGYEMVKYDNILDAGLTELGRFSPKLGRGICFNGDHFHANEFCNADERRMVCVITFK